MGSNVLVYLDRDPSTGRNLAEGENPVSALLGGLPKSYEHNVKKCRVFIHPAAMEQLGKLRNLEDVRDKVREFLEGHYKIPSGLAR